MQMSQEQLNQHKTQKNKAESTKELLKYLMRSVSCCYRSVIFPISTFVSFLTISDVRGPLTLLFTFILCNTIQLFFTLFSSCFE